MFRLAKVPLSNLLKVHSQGVDFVYPYGDVIPLTFDKSYVECKVKTKNKKEEILLKGYIHEVEILYNKGKRPHFSFFIAPVEGPDKDGFYHSSQWLYADYDDIVELKADERLVTGEWQQIKNFRDI